MESRETRAECREPEEVRVFLWHLSLNSPLSIPIDQLGRVAASFRPNNGLAIVLLLNNKHIDDGKTVIFEMELDPLLLFVKFFKV